MKSLKFDINAYSMIEQVTGFSINELIGSEKNMEKISNLRALYWGGRIHDNEKMSMTEAGREIQERLNSGESLGDIVEAISEAIVSSGLIPNKGDIEDIDPNPQTAPSVKA